MINAVNSTPAVTMVNVSKSFGDFRALDDINLTVMNGEKVVVCGP